MLHDRQHFQMREAVLHRIRRQLLGQLAIRHPFVQRSPQPGFQVHFVHRHRLAQQIPVRAILHPPRVAPLIVRQRPDDRRRLGRHLGEESARIAVILLVPVRHHHRVFVVRARREPGQKNLPQASVAQTHGMARAIPAVVVAGDADHLGIGSPYREANTRDAFARDQVRSQRAVGLVVRAFAMQVQFERGQQGRESIRIFQFLRFAGVECDPEAILRGLTLRDKESRRIRALHRDDLVAGEDESVFRLREPGADLSFVRTQVREWIAMPALYDQLSLSCGHFS